MMAKISEIFESIQGEGIYTGIPQVFVRFFGCHLKCRYCDTPLEHFREYDVPRLLQAVSACKNHHSVCLTGGEPLLQVDFLKSFLEELRSHHDKVYLETNGVLTDALARVIDLVDIVAMDFKLPSATGAGAFWEEHEAFLGLAARRDVFVKLVVTSATHPEDIVISRHIIKKVSSRVPVVLQPAWGEDFSDLVPKLMDFKRDFTLDGIQDVRILPQAHKLVGIR
jgi:7-carboxy-7-deazaguanine synthase